MMRITLIFKILLTPNLNFYFYLLEKKELIPFLIYYYFLFLRNIKLYQIYVNI